MYINNVRNKAYIPFKAELNITNEDSINEAQLLTLNPHLKKFSNDTKKYSQLRLGIIDIDKNGNINDFCLNKMTKQTDGIYEEVFVQIKTFFVEPINIFSETFYKDLLKKFYEMLALNKAIEEAPEMDYFMRKANMRF